MADLQQVFEEAVRLNQDITQFLKASTYFEYDDLSGLDGIDRTNGEQILLWEELRFITEKLADAQERIAYLTRPIAETCRLQRGVPGSIRRRGARSTAAAAASRPWWPMNTMMCPTGPEPLWSMTARITTS